MKSRQSFDATSADLGRKALNSSAPSGCPSSVGLRQLYLVGLFVVCLYAAACQPSSERIGTNDIDTPTTEPNVSIGQAAPLPLRIPISAVMVGTINRSSNEVFQAMASANSLSDDDWLRLGEAAVGLVGDATLITVAGTGPKDAAWVAELSWIRFSKEMQTASFDIGRAASQKDPATLIEATARLAQSCQSCHLVFSPHLVTSSPGLEALPARP